MANQVPNVWKGQIWKPFLTAFDALNVYKMILMQPGFVFNKDSDNTYATAHVSSNEVPNGNGYTTGGVTLTGQSRDINNTEDRCKITWNNAQWNATGGSISASGAIIYLNRAAGTYFEYTDIVVSYKDAGGTITATDGSPIIISAVMETVEDK